MFQLEWVNQVWENAKNDIFKLNSNFTNSNCQVKESLLVDIFKKDFVFNKWKINFISNKT